ncbi:MAG: OST-HTH/LOTUS domain-containing protein, partial [Candidatus Aminicenantes bacterium]|nr:OST-HTH/LOTUS domain-containing protein [Candidatus Aminicenantes bacterium]
QSQDDVTVKASKPRSAKELRCDTKLLNLVRSAIEAASDETGWAQLSPVGSYISKTANDFDPRNYGFSKLSELIMAIGLFEIDRRENRVYVKHTHKKATPGLGSGHAM